MVSIEWIRRARGPGRWDAFAATGLAAWAIAFAFPHLPWLRAAWPGCLFRAFTGLPCGTCGFTRAFTAAARFDLEAAFSASPLGAASFLAWLLASLAIAATWISPRAPLPRPRFHPLLVRFAPLALFLSNWAWLLWRARFAGAAA